MLSQTHTRKLRGTDAMIHNSIQDHGDGTPPGRKMFRSESSGRNPDQNTVSPKPNTPHTMNTNKIVAALAVLLAVGSASAQTKTNYAPGNVVYIAGSTALGSVSIPALSNAAVAAGYTLVASDTTNSGGVINPSKIGLWTKVDRTVSGTTATIKTNAISLHLIGSEGGIAVAASKAALGDFLPPNATGKVNGDTTGAGGQGYTPSSSCTVKANATIAFSDCDQAVGRFNTARTAPVKCVALTKVADLAVINFAFVAGTNFPANNISDRVAQALLTRGHVPLSMFTGSVGDSTKGVFITGRDIDSGTRVLTTVETGVGALANLQQYVFDKNATNLGISRAGSVNNVSYLAGNGGHFSGGDLCQAVFDSVNLGWNGAMATGSTNPYANGSYLIGYTSSPDLISKGGSAPSNKIKALSYNGVQPYAQAGTHGFQNSNSVIASGAYSMWSVGKLYKNEAFAPKGTDKTFIGALATTMANEITGKTSAQLSSTAGYLKNSDLNVTRSTEGAVIFAK